MKSVVLSVMVIVATGCATATTSRRVEATLEATLPGCHFERDEALVLGRSSLALLRWLSGASGDELDEDTREILRGVRRIEVTSYHATHGCEVVDAAPPLSRQLAGDGWRTAVAAVEDDGGLAWVLMRDGPDGGTSGLLVVALGREELEVVRLDGDIDRVLVAAVSDDPSTVIGLAGVGNKPGATANEAPLRSD